MSALTYLFAEYNSFLIALTISFSGELDTFEYNNADVTDQVACQDRTIAIV